MTNIEKLKLEANLNFPNCVDLFIDEGENSNGERILTIFVKNPQAQIQVAKNLPLFAKYGYSWVNLVVPQTGVKYRDILAGFIGYFYSPSDQSAK